MSRVSEVFGEHRGVLFSVAYRMLGSVADAEDAVQDAWLRWSADDRSGVADPKAYLIRTVSRLALNRLHSARARRESYVGPWLPEPLLTSPDVAEDVERAESVSLAMLVVLETLSPAERAVFVLREVFGTPYAEIAATLDCGEAAVRQLAHRAREHVRERRPRYDTDRRTREEATRRFLAACVGGDLGALMRLLAPDVVLHSDAGGKGKAPRRNVYGADKVARFFIAVAGRGDVAGLSLRFADVNGVPGFVLDSGDAPDGGFVLDVTDGLVTAIWIARNPDKLTGLTGEARTL
ncbi:MAG: RNA polymerase sigma-70 factor [Streptosporangiales bacterium]|nr:RNA polymerase sigma-70 factor [Streptosporangiales bacterium]